MRRPRTTTSIFVKSQWARRIVERRLRAEAGAARRPAPADLGRRTMASLDRAEAAPTSWIFTARPYPAYATAAGLLLLVAVLGWVQRPAPRAHDAEPSQATPPVALR